MTRNNSENKILQNNTNSAENLTDQTGSVPFLNDQKEGQKTENGKLTSSHRFLDTLHFMFALCLVTGVLFYLIKTPADSVSISAQKESRAEESEVQLLSNGDIELKETASFRKRLAVENVVKAKTRDPLFEVSGNVLCSYRISGNEYQWQFSSSDLLTLFTDWQKSKNDSAFYEKQLASAKELAETKIDALAKQVDRKKKLVKIGTDTEQDLASSEAELLQVQIEERKNIYSAETDLRMAQKQESTLTRQLEQSCLKPNLLENISPDHDIIRANIPGSFFNKVSIGQECRASFQNLPGIYFTGKICEIIPVLSQELGMLCVLFVVEDPKDLLRPGMFADIGIGTEEREILTVPPAAVVHIGESDFVLTQKKQKKKNLWSIQKILTGSLHENGLEIVSGLSADDQIIGQGVILLKGYMSDIIDLMKKKDTSSSKQTNRNEGDKK